jgi:hypothetical protein
MFGRMRDVTRTCDAAPLIAAETPRHLGWLRHDFASNPNVRLRKLAEFVK